MVLSAERLHLTPPTGQHIRDFIDFCVSQPKMPLHFLPLSKGISKAMLTIRLQVHEAIYDKLLWFLGKFSREEIQILPEPDNFESDRQYLVAELDEILSGKAEFLSFEAAEKRLRYLAGEGADRI